MGTATRSDGPIPHLVSTTKLLGTDLLGLGVVSTSDHQVQGNGWLPTLFVQLDVTSILSQGFTDRKVQIGDVHNDETFVIWGSNKLVASGQQLAAFTPACPGLPSSMSGILGTTTFISVGAVNRGVLPVAFQATLALVPQMRAPFPIIGLVNAASAMQPLSAAKLPSIALPP